MLGFSMVLAEREGFEPSIHFWRIHTFQACSFNHSDTSPDGCKGIPFFWCNKKQSIAANNFLSFIEFMPYFL